MEGGFAKLPDDIKLEILARVPLDSIPACRSVCSDWRRITYDSDFATAHSHRTRSISGCFVQHAKCNRYVTPRFIPYPLSLHPTVPLSLKFLPVQVQIEAVSEHHGIVLCASYWSGSPAYYVCKPATRQWKSIPIPSSRLQTVRTAIVVRPMGYKIVRISRAEDNQDYLHCEVFDSRSSLWRDSKGAGMLPNLFGWRPSRPRNKHGVLVCGALHWLTSDDGIFAFDVQAEEWRLIPLPETGRQLGDYKYKRIAGCQGKLWLLDVTTLMEKNERKAWMEVWTMTNYSNERWESRGVVNLEAPKDCENIKYLYTSEVAVVGGPFHIAWFDMKKGKRTSVQLAGFQEEIYMFETDTEPWELDSGVRKRKKRKMMTDLYVRD